MVWNLLVRKKIRAHTVVHNAMQYIASASNSALIRNADYLLTEMDTDIDIKSVGESRQRVNKS